jgi:hypothetical protein
MRLGNGLTRKWRRNHGIGDRPACQGVARISFL